MTTTTEMFWKLFQSTGSLEAYLLYRQNQDDRSGN
jgi:hypothetical protein